MRTELLLLAPFVNPNKLTQSTINLLRCSVARHHDLTTINLMFTHRIQMRKDSFTFSREPREAPSTVVSLSATATACTPKWVTGVDDLYPARQHLITATALLRFLVLLVHNKDSTQQQKSRIAQTHFVVCQVVSVCVSSQSTTNHVSRLAG